LHELFTNGPARLKLPGACSRLYLPYAAAARRELKPTGQRWLSWTGIYWTKVIISRTKIAVPDEIYERVRKVATAEGTTVEELATKALERDLARGWLDRVGP
jgi:hypothetical protein